MGRFGIRVAAGSGTVASLSIGNAGAGNCWARPNGGDNDEDVDDLPFQ